MTWGAVNGAVLLLVATLVAVWTVAAILADPEGDE